MFCELEHDHIIYKLVCRRKLNSYYNNEFSPQIGTHRWDAFTIVCNVRYCTAIFVFKK